MTPRVVVLDSCVLHSAALRDLFMRLDNADLCGARWTEEIHEEWMRSALLRRPDLSRATLERTRALMDLHAERSIVEDYRPITPTLTLPDPDDRHVLAAAIVAEAPTIVTFNLADFPETELSRHGVAAQHPDDFLCCLFDEEPERFMGVIAGLLTSLRNPPRTLHEHTQALSRQGLVRLAQRLSSRRVG